jgi:amino acid transporter, AAT family
LPILIICGVIPWNQVSTEESPFVQVFSLTGLPGAADIMNFVLLTAVLSAANSGIYATSRTLFTLSHNREAPKVFIKTTKKGIPLNGIFLTTLCILFGVFLSYLTPDLILSYLMAIPGFTVLLLWISICSAQLKLRKQYTDEPGFRVKWYPYTTIFAIIALSFIFIAFIFNKQNIIGTTVCLVTVAVFILLSFLVKQKKSAKK